VHSTLFSVGLMHELLLGKELFIRGVSEGLREKDLIKFFKKNRIAVENVELPNGKS